MDFLPIAKKLSAQLKSMGADVHPSKLEMWLERELGDYETPALDAIKMFLEWGACKTGSDRDLFDDKFRKVLNQAGVKFEEPD